MISWRWIWYWFQWRSCCWVNGRVPCLLVSVRLFIWFCIICFAVPWEWKKEKTKCHLWSATTWERSRMCYCPDVRMCVRFHTNSSFILHLCSRDDGWVSDAFRGYASKRQPPSNHNTDPGVNPQLRACNQIRLFILLQGPRRKSSGGSCVQAFVLYMLIHSLILINNTPVIMFIVIWQKHPSVM